MNNNLQFSENQKEVIRAFLNNDLNKDHYKEGYTFDRYSAVVKDIYGDPIFIPNNMEKTNRNIKIMMSMLKGMKISSDDLMISDNGIILSFSNRNVYFDNIYDYFVYSMEFAEYIDKIDFCTMKINTGSFIDSPREIARDQLIKAEHYNSDFEKMEPYEWRIFDFREGKYTFGIEFDAFLQP